MFINGFYQENIACFDKDIVIGKNRAIYYSDLYKLYEKNISLSFDEETFSYQFLTSCLMEKISADIKNKEYDWVIFPHYFHSWEDGYAVPEFYIKKYYGLKGDFLDCRDCGSLCIYQAIFLLQKMHASGLVITIESDPVYYRNHYVGFLEISHDIQKNSVRLLDVIFFCEKEYFSIKNATKTFLAKNNLRDDQVTFFYHEEFNNSFYAGFIYHVMNYLSKVKKRFYKKYIVIIDKEINSNRYVFFLMEKMNEKKY